jgi:cell division protein FtsW (lipid II flippase)
MTSRNISLGKPVASVLVTLLWVIGFVAIPSISWHIPDDAKNYALALNPKWIWIVLFAVIWLMFQLFWNSSKETSRLSMAVSYTPLWLALVFFFPFKDPTIESQAGAEAFFALAGGLGVVLVWTRFLSDEV